MAHVLVDKFHDVYPDFDTLHRQLETWLQQAQELSAYDGRPSSYRQAVAMQRMVVHLLEVAVDEANASTFVGMATNLTVTVEDTTVEDPVRSVHRYDATPNDTTGTLDALFS